MTTLIRRLNAYKIKDNTVVREAPVYQFGDTPAIGTTWTHMLYATLPARARIYASANNFLEVLAIGSDSVDVVGSRGNGVSLNVATGNTELWDGTDRELEIASGTAKTLTQYKASVDAISGFAGVIRGTASQTGFNSADSEFSGGHDDEDKLIEISGQTSCYAYFGDNASTAPSNNEVDVVGMAGPGPYKFVLPKGKHLWLRGSDNNRDLFMQVWLLD